MTKPKKREWFPIPPRELAWIKRGGMAYLRGCPRWRCPYKSDIARYAWWEGWDKQEQWVGKLIAENNAKRRRPQPVQGED